MQRFNGAEKSSHMHVLDSRLVVRTTLCRRILHLVILLPMNEKRIGKRKFVAINWTRKNNENSWNTSLPMKNWIWYQFRKNFVRFICFAKKRKKSRKGQKSIRAYVACRIRYCVDSPFSKDLIKLSITCF